MHKTKDKDKKRFLEIILQDFLLNNIILKTFFKFTVAIDGPAAAGKGTISRAVAQQFGFAHLDTGLLYRAVGIKGGDPVLAARSLTAEDLARGDLRTLEAGQAASRVAVLAEVRAALTDFQRQFARREGGAVLDGRDICTVICPDAEVKLFVTASAEIRARRRWLELGGEAGEEEDEEEADEVPAAVDPYRCNMAWTRTVCETTRMQNGTAL